jgi:hypothetical protein
MIPEFVDGLNLAPGGHRCTLEEVKDRFGQGPARLHLIDKLVHLIGQAKKCGFVNLIIGGSFATAKENPKDLDLTWFGPIGVNKDNAKGICAELMDQQTSRDRFGCDLMYIEKSSTWPDQIEFFANQFGFDAKTNTERGTLILELL